MILSDEEESIRFTVTGTGWAKDKWKEWALSEGHEISSWAMEMLSKPDYDAKHRLEEGKEYVVRFVFGKEIRQDHKRTTDNVKLFAGLKFGDQGNPNLKAELAFLIRQKFTNADLEKMGVWRIVVLHEPIVIFGDEQCVFRADRFDGDSSVGADNGDPDSQWGGGVVFAFVVSP